MDRGGFIISLDFELHWGAPELWDLKVKKDYFDNTRKSVPEVLSLFKKYGIHATWATVGFLFANDKKQLLEFSPDQKPHYKNNNFNYYKLIDENVVGENEMNDPYHFAPTLIKKIADTPNQEVGSHTFSHYYCNEPGQNVKQFSADLKAAQQLSKANFNIELKSLVFPRNQFNEEYISAAKKSGIKVVRSNPDVWFWKEKFSNIAPLARAWDTLFPINKTLTFNDQLSYVDNVLLLPASRFLRAYTAKEKSVQQLKMNRIKAEMLYAAKNDRYYHLWWHPHNFGNAVKENLYYLEEVLIYFKDLNRTYDFPSMSMIEMHDNLAGKK